MMAVSTGWLIIRWANEVKLATDEGWRCPIRTTCARCQSLRLSRLTNLLHSIA